MDILLTDREADIMQLLWEHGPSVVAEVRDRLRDELAYTTVLTVLRTLEAKGYAKHDEEGRGAPLFRRCPASGSPQECAAASDEKAVRRLGRAAAGAPGV